MCNDTETENYVGQQDVGSYVGVCLRRHDAFQVSHGCPPDPSTREPTQCGLTNDIQTRKALGQASTVTSIVLCLQMSHFVIDRGEQPGRCLHTAQIPFT